MNKITKASPFLKWVGGKRSIICELTSRLPKKFRNYHEPFVGGGALFFELQDSLKKAFLSDMNPELISCYKSIQQRPDKLIELLSEHAEFHSQEYFYRVRAEPVPKNSLQRAARMLYLNRTCYNGLYRVNREGKFNSPLGNYKNPNIIQRQNILACHEVLQGVEIARHDFSKISAQKGDFVYFDPPYHPLGTTSFTSYTGSDFTAGDQVRLWEFVGRLDRSGVFFMLSNSDTPFIRALYHDFCIHTVRAPRNVNCKSNQRSAVNELLITNYK